MGITKVPGRQATVHARAVALGSRARPGTLASPLLAAAAAAALARPLAVLYLPFLRDLLRTQPLTLADLAVIFALSTLGFAAVRLDRVPHPHRNGAAVPGAGLGPGRGERSPAWPR